tara:strand:- start:760 stop:951 length:192 start_codon:yes stop_codon:yes gene_type:complete
MFLYLFVIINNLVRNNNIIFQNKESNNDAALIPFEDLPKNEFYKNFTNNNYSKKDRGIIYPPE